jgi:hypothetical protein
MKKIISTMLLGSMLALTPVMPTSASAAVVPFAPFPEEFVELADLELVESGESASVSAIKPCPSGTFRVRRRTSTKKRVVNSLIAGGIGTAIGAGVGGKRGALIGAGSGAGGYLVYRYVRDRRGRCVRSYR